MQFWGVFFFFVISYCSLFAGVNNRKIGLIVRHGFRGEIVLAQRIKSACENLHWKADIIDIDNPEELKQEEYTFLSPKSEKQHYDFVINLIPVDYRYPHCKNYLAIFHPAHHHFDKQGRLWKKFRRYDGYLITYAPDPDKYQFDTPSLRWYPSVQKRAYQKVNPSHLFHLCCLWGNRFEEARFKNCLSLLDQESYMRLYGASFLRALYPHQYQGSIPFDEKTFYKLSSEAGITLVLHSSDHNAYGLPSGRIFEAAATSTVIICDENAFVRERFGDSVLYIDTNEDGLSMYRQIQKHMQWIGDHPIEALEKAKKAHSICTEQFAMEDQLLRLGELHDYLTTQDLYAFLSAVSP